MEIKLQLNYCKIKKKIQKYFEGILNFLVFQILGFPNTPPPHDFSRNIKGSSGEL